MLADREMAILTDDSLDFVSNSEEQTVRLGIRLGELLQPPDMLCLTGDLGAGKTVLARGVARGWGTASRVTSPTYTLVHEYPRALDGCILYHIDCYRLHDSADIITAGLEDILLAAAVFLIEWPERIRAFLPPDHLWIELRHVSETRRGLRVTAHGPRAQQRLKEFRLSAFGY